MSSGHSSMQVAALRGGPPACEFSWPDWPIYDEREEAGLLEVLRSRKWWFGDRVRQFESEFATFQGADFAVTCTNGTTALEMGLRALGVVEGDQVIVPPYSFIATASAVVTIGAIPVFADILGDTLCLDPDDFQRKITPQTKAVIPVHVGGRIADMNRINQVARQHGLAVLEDAAHAWGSQLDGRGAGTLGQCGTFSFQETKNITAGEGGILVTNDSELAELCRSYTHCGRKEDTNWYDHDLLGSNLRMTEFQAAVLLAQCSRLPEQVAKREKNATILDQIVKDQLALQVQPSTPEMNRRSYHMYIFRVDEEALGMPRDRFIEALNAEGVPAIAGWYQPLYNNGVFQRANVGPAHGIKSPLANKGVDYSNVSCPVCEQVCRDAVWIPHQILLAEESKIQQLGEAIEKVVVCADQLR